MFNKNLKTTLFFLSIMLGFFVSLGVSGQLTFPFLPPENPNPITPPLEPKFATLLKEFDELANNPNQSWIVGADNKATYTFGAGGGGAITDKLTATKFESADGFGFNIHSNFLFSIEYLKRLLNSKSLSMVIKNADSSGNHFGAP